MNSKYSTLLIRLNARIKECAFFTEARYKWASGNRYLYHIAYKENSNSVFSVLEIFDNLMSEEVFEVHRIVVAPVARLTQMKLSLAATFMITTSLFIALFITSVPVFADTLVVGSVYFDSEQTLKEVIKLSAQHDNEGIAKLIENGHISDQTRDEMDIVVLISGSTSESPAEFRFLNGPTTYWTLTKNVTNFAKPIPASVSTPIPIPTPTPESTPTESPTPTSKHHYRQYESDAPFDDDKGQRIWHQVDGKWKWYPANKHHVPVKKALPPDEAPLVKP